MVRPVTISAAPPFHPFICLRCKLGTGAREYFVDLGLDISGEFNPMYEGSIFYCNECAKNLVTDLIQAIAKWDLEHAPWDGEDKAVITYNWESKVDLSGPDYTGISGSDPGTEGDNLSTEPSESVSTTADDLPEGTVPPVSGPDQPGRSLSISRDGFPGFD